MYVKPEVRACMCVWGFGGGNPVTLSSHYRKEREGEGEKEREREVNKSRILWFEIGVKGVSERVFALPCLPLPSCVWARLGKARLG